MSDQKINVEIAADSSGLVDAASRASASLSNIAAETKTANQHLSRISTTNRVAAKSLLEVAAASKDTVSEPDIQQTG